MKEETQDMCCKVTTNPDYGEIKNIFSSKWKKKRKRKRKKKKKKNEHREEWMNDE
jgi:hypothetical protein